MRRWTRRAAAGAVILAGYVSAAWAVAVDVSRTYQTIDGFGFFGPRTTWWSSSNPSAFYNQAWLNMVIDTLGITIWRNEYYSEEPNQDANWAKQLPAVQALHNKAVASGNPLKFIFSVWSPPSAMKVACSNGCWGSPTTSSWSQGLKGGGCLATAQVSAFGNWLVDGVRKYADAGIQLYALSFQNEPLFCEPYNSCFHEYGYYTAVLKTIRPIVRTAYPNVKFFGAEHMLSANMDNGNSQFQWIYEANICHDATARGYMDIWAYHGYSDGVNPIPGSEMARLWSLVRDSLARYGNKPIWMTETSGYNDTWGAGGAQELAAAMFAALQYGNLAGWVYWYGAGDWLNESTDRLTKRGYVSKHFSRYIRPGAVRVDVGSTGNNNVFVAAFRHTTLNNFVVLALNTGTSAYNLSLTGAGVPSEFTLYRTTGTDNCVNAGTVSSSGVTLAASSLNTLVAGSVYEAPTAVRPSPRASASALVSGARAGRRVYGLDGRLAAGGGTVARCAASGAYFSVGPDGGVRVVMAGR